MLSLHVAGRAVGHNDIESAVKHHFFCLRTIGIVRHYIFDAGAGNIDDFQIAGNGLLCIVEIKLLIYRVPRTLGSMAGVPYIFMFPTPWKIFSGLSLVPAVR